MASPKVKAAKVARHLMTLDDAPQPPALPWATWIPTRTPQWKLHNSIGQAKNAIGTNDYRNSRNRPTKTGGYTTDHPIVGGIMYRVEGGTWVEIARFEPGTYKDDHLAFSNPRKWNAQPGITHVIHEHPFAP